MVSIHVLAISGPSGSGKTTIARALRHELNYVRGVYVIEQSIKDRIKRMAHRLFDQPIPANFFEGPGKDVPQERLEGLVPRDLYVAISRLVREALGFAWFGIKAAEELLSRVAVFQHDVYVIVEVANAVEAAAFASVLRSDAELGRLDLFFLEREGATFNERRDDRRDIRPELSALRDPEWRITTVQNNGKAPAQVAQEIADSLNVPK